MFRSPQLPEFFVDRSLGRHLVAQALRVAGWTLRTHYEVFGARDDEVPDVEWLDYVGREDLPVLTKDRRLRYRPDEIASVRRHRIKLFVLARSDLRADVQADRFDRNVNRTVAACLDPGPCVYAVHATEIVRLFP